MVVDVRGMEKEMARDVIGKFINSQMKCVKNDLDGHRWSSHEWLNEAKVWIWGPCLYCGLVRVSQVYGNIVLMDAKGYVRDVLIVNDEFEDWKEKVKQVVAHLKLQ